MNSSHSRAEMAHLLGLSETRLQQLTGLGIVTRSGGAYEPLETALAYIKYLKRDDEAKAARTRQVNATALRIEQKVRREQRRMLTVDELQEVAILIFEGARDSCQAESSRFYSEFSKSHSEHDSRLMTFKIYDPLDRLIMGWANGIIELMREINEDRLPDDARLDDVLKRIISEIAAGAAADAKTLAKPKPAR